MLSTIKSAWNIDSWLYRFPVGVQASAKEKVVSERRLWKLRRLMR